ncbi:hypothetical protein [Variovorax sp. GT1P44]|uniref:hypothetical protein n=1 Tax=Variovorax sp. GT1P44 TaxID=3443742 RepID=UPI003F471D5D
MSGAAKHQHTAAQQNNPERGFGMEWMHWLIATFVACVGVVWFSLIRPAQHRRWQSLDERMAAQVTQSAELLSECSGSGKVGARLSTIR